MQNYNFETLESYKTALRIALRTACEKTDPSLNLKIYPSISRTYELVFTKNGKEFTPDKQFAQTLEQNFKFIINKGGKPKTYADMKPIPAEENLPSLEDLENYQFNFVDKRIYVGYPRKELGYRLASFHQEPIFQEALNKARKFGNDTGLSSVKGISTFLKKYGVVDLIQICEDRMRDQMFTIVNKIMEKKIRFVAISGPSCSGKTTTANKLRISLMSKGLNPLRISLDDYYLLPADCPKNPDGTNDLESIEALDIKEFEKEMISLLDGKETKLRTFHFDTKTIDYKRTEKLDSNQPIILEGIHALNPKLLNGINPNLIYRVYICPQPQILVDDITPFPFSDIRLLRRLVRDERTRATSFEATFAMWDKVREEEFDTIYGGEEYADFVFDSFYPYELCVMKKLTVPELGKIKEASPFHSWAKRLCLNLEPLPTFDLQNIPVDSTFREFIGGGSFKG